MDPPPPPPPNGPDPPFSDRKCSQLAQTHPMEHSHQPRMMQLWRGLQRMYFLLIKSVQRNAFAGVRTRTHSSIRCCRTFWLSGTKGQVFVRHEGSVAAGSKKKRALVRIQMSPPIIMLRRAMYGLVPHPLRAASHHLSAEQYKQDKIK